MRYFLASLFMCFPLQLLAQSPFDESKILQAELDYRLAGLQLDAADRACAQLRSSRSFNGTDVECILAVKESARACAQQAKAAVLASAAASRRLADFDEAPLEAAGIESCIVQRAAEKSSDEQ